jgi:hypothetical protein
MLFTFLGSWEKILQDIGTCQNSRATGPSVKTPNPGVADAALVQTSPYRVLKLETGPDTAATPCTAAHFSLGMTTPLKRPKAGLRPCP